MFRWLFMGLCLGLLYGAPCSPVLILAWILPWIPALARRWRRHKTGSAFFLLLGLLLGLGTSPADPALGAVESGDEIEFSGRWERTVWRKGQLFAGRLLGQPRLLCRGVGKQLPSDGSAFSCSGLMLPSPGGGRELRVLQWQAERKDTDALHASRKARLAGSRAILFPLTEHYPARTRPLARALLFGDRRALSRDAREDFRRAGLAHLLALSGLHLGLFLLLLRRLLTLSGLGPFRAEYLLIALLPFLPAWAGGGPSINRAVVMAAYMLLARRLGGRVPTIEALSCAGVVELLRSPASIFHPGFQLSYLATLALLCGFRQGRRASTGMKSWLGEGLTASFLCVGATLPVVILVFDRLAPSGPLWNLAASPVCALALPCGWLALPFGSGPLSTYAALPASLLLDLMALIADWAARLPILTDFNVPTWSWLLWSAGFCLLATAGHHRRWGWLLLLTPVLLGWPSLSAP